jgi:hypothetical protein
MKAPELMLHCMAWKSGDQWIAICLDFDLAAQDDTLSAAKQRLSDQIVSYLKEAIIGEDKEHAGYLLNRRAPMRYWIRYYVCVLAHKLRVRANACEYSSPVPLIPA